MGSYGSGESHVTFSFFYTLCTANATYSRPPTHTHTHNPLHNVQRVFLVKTDGVAFQVALLLSLGFRLCRWWWWQRWWWCK